MTRKRPFGVTILAVLAAVAAIVAIYHTLQMLSLLPIRGPLGVFQFFGFNLFGAIMWAVLAFIYIWVVRMLWNLDARGWVFVVAIAALNLIFAVISIIGQSSWQAMAPAIVVNGLVLIYGLLPGTKAAFQIEEMQQAAKAAHIAPASDPEPEMPPATEVYVEEYMPETAVAEVEAEAEMMEEMEETAVAPETAAEPDPPAPTTAQVIDAAAHASPGKAAKFSAHTDFIEGIGPVYAGKLKEAGIETPQAFLEATATRQGREELSEKTEISPKLILKWAHEADLFRINGVGAQYAQLLDVAGVNTVLELAQRNPEKLHQTLIEVNQEKHLVHEVPSLNNVISWVEQAKEMPRVISF